MKQFLLSVVIFISVTGIFSACNNSDGVTPAVNQTVSATINNVAFNTDTVVANHINSSKGISVTGNYVSIVNFNISDYTGVGTYAIGNDTAGNASGNTAIYNDGSVAHTAQSGQIIVTLSQTTQLGINIVGTFNFIAGPDTLSNGTFNVTLIQ